MPARDYRDILGGGALILAGAFIAFHSITTLNLGTISNMGPGMFPAALGFILAGLGAFIFGPALFREGSALTIDVRSLAAILTSVLAFALMLRPFGLIPAIVALTLIASRSDSKLSLLGTAILAAGLSLSAVLIFQVGLGLQIATVAWPW